MAKIKVLAGDFNKHGANSYSFGSFVLVPKESTWGKSKSYTAKRGLKSISEASEETGVRVFGAVGWGTVGVILAGPVGAIIGGIIGGRGKKITFIAEFTDGKKLMGEMDSKAWTKVMAERF